MVHIYPSLMAADQLNLEKEIHLLESHCHGFHLDVMDNHFVPNITWGAATVNAIAAMSNVWVHLMIDNPMNFYEQLILKPDTLISFHIESEIDFFDGIKKIKEKKHRLSIAISPKTAISRIVPFLDILDQVLVMSVEPGFSGQSFLSNTVERLAELVEHRQSHGGNWRIGVDGGVNATNIAMLAAHGVDDYAIGDGIFQQKNSVETLQELQKKFKE